MHKLPGPLRILVREANRMPQRRFPPGQLGLDPAGFGGRRFAQLGRGRKPRPYPVGAIGVALLDHPGQRPGGLGEPVLQVASRPADLAAYQAGGLTAGMLAGRPPAEFAGKPTAHGAGQQFSLAGILAVV